jgi:hypothetical protein
MPASCPCDWFMIAAGGRPPTLLVNPSTAAVDPKHLQHSLGLKNLWIMPTEIFPGLLAILRS